MADREEGQGPIALLRSVPLFADLEEGELERFSRVAVARSFPAATRVFHEGDHSDACYIVRDGSFRVTREHSDGRAITARSPRKTTGRSMSSGCSSSSATTLARVV